MLRRLAGLRQSSQELSQSSSRNGLLAIEALIAIKIALLFGLAWNSRFVPDEFVQLGWAKYLGHGLYDTVWHPKAVGYVVFYKAAHLIGRDATSILLIGRIQTALLACATLVIVYAIARALGEGRLRALLILFLLLCFSNFIERIFRTIAEPLAVFFAAASLLAVVRGDPERPRDALAAGVLTGLAFLATQKALYFNVALGVGLVGDALLARHSKVAFVRGAWLLLGWVLSIAAYCLIFGGTAPVPVLRNLLLGPLAVATHGGDAYGGSVRLYVTQTVLRNAGLYAFCVVGILLELARIGRLAERRRIALIFTIVVTVLVFAHNQPWPYVFIMAQPFMALWALILLDRLAPKPRWLQLAWVLLIVAIIISFARNASALRIDNQEQLKLVNRAEALLAPDEIYFDGVGMLPNRREPSTLWLDQHSILETLREGKSSEAYRIFATSPPKVILWSNRMDAIEPVVGPLIDRSYVKVSPNIRIVGRELTLGQTMVFNVPISGTYGLYDNRGQRLTGLVEVGGGRLFSGSLKLAKGKSELTLRNGPATALLLPLGSYEGVIGAGPDSHQLFADVYR